MHHGHSPQQYTRHVDNNVALLAFLCKTASPFFAQRLIKR
jgi:hypothetical protein